MKCLDCKHWRRCIVNDWPNSDKALNIGECFHVNSHAVNYYDDSEIASEKIEEGKIGCDNLYTHENFGCIHYDPKAK